MASYFDQKKKKYIVNSDTVERKEFPEQPGMMDYVKEAFEDDNTKAQLEALRKRRQSRNDQSY